jgi:hypothetical protein
MIPYKPQDHPLVALGQSAYMLIDLPDITFGGAECNKIGVSFEAFTYQSDK